MRVFYKEQGRDMDKMKERRRQSASTVRSDSVTDFQIAVISSRIRRFPPRDLIRRRPRHHDDDDDGNDDGRRALGWGPACVRAPLQRVTHALWLVM